MAPAVSAAVRRLGAARETSADAFRSDFPAAPPSGRSPANPLDPRSSPRPPAGAGDDLPALSAADTVRGQLRRGTSARRRTLPPASLAVQPVPGRRRRLRAGAAPAPCAGTLRVSASSTRGPSSRKEMPARSPATACPGFRPQVAAPRRAVTAWFPAAAVPFPATRRRHTARVMRSLFFLRVGMECIV